MSLFSNLTASELLNAGGIPGVTPGMPEHFQDITYEMWCAVQGLPDETVLLGDSPIADDDVSELSNDELLREFDLKAPLPLSPLWPGDNVESTVPEIDEMLANDDLMSFSMVHSHVEGCGDVTKPGDIATTTTKAADSAPQISLSGTPAVNDNITRIAEALARNPEALELARIVTSTPSETKKARKPRSKRRTIPDEEKDEKYWERRRRNTLAVRRNRARKKLIQKVAQGSADVSAIEAAQVKLNAIVTPDLISQ
jgi:hypothetical protein